MSGGRKSAAGRARTSMALQDGHYDDLCSRKKGNGCAYMYVLLQETIACRSQTKRVISAP